MKMIQKQLTILAFPMRAKAVANDSTLMTSSVGKINENSKVKRFMTTLAICYLDLYVLER